MHYDEDVGAAFCYTTHRCKMLMNSIAKERISHAYLLEGGKGTGKFATAIQMAKSFLCSERNGVEPCHVCTNCKRIDSGNHPNLHIVKPDGLSIKSSKFMIYKKSFQNRIRGK